MIAARVPMTGELADLIGPFAEHVENRSLLLDKFAFHKHWGLGESMANDAHRWSLLRVAEGGPAQLAKEAAIRKDQASHLERKNPNPEKVQRLRVEAQLAAQLSNTARQPEEAKGLRTRHTHRFLRLFQDAYGDRAEICVGRLEGRLAINLADGLIENAGICLDRLFGQPFIPGSAIKGVSRHAALDEIRRASSGEQAALLAVFRAVFGVACSDDLGGLDPSKTHEQKGAVTFLPAYPVNEAKIVVDITNVHYPDYYRSGLEGDQKNESPRPNPFPVVEAGAEFAFCMVLTQANSNKDLLAHARRWLEMALVVRGLGAKTAAGYGWFSIQNESLHRILEDEARRKAENLRLASAKREAKEAEDRERLRQSSLSPEELAREKLLAMEDQEFASTATGLATRPEPCQRAMIGLFREGGPKRDVWKRWRKKKPHIADAVAGVATRLGLPPIP